MDENAIGWKKGLGLLVVTLLISDFIILLYDLGSHGRLGCAEEGWVTVGPWTYLFKLDVCPTPTTVPPKAGKDKCPNTLGKYKTYVTGTDKDYLCVDEIDTLVKSVKSDNVMGGYNVTQLLAYIIVPFMTCIGIIYALVFTRPSYAEWIFWILLATLIYTGLTSIAYSTDVDIIPEQQHRPLNYIIDKFDMQSSDELKYSFIARKQDGKECFIEGTMLGGGTHPENQPPTYSGDCNSENLPL